MLEKLATGFVECTTEFDYAPLPDNVKASLLEAAHELHSWIETQGVYRIGDKEIVS
ncbi:hypothetical protein [Curtobacterium sp. MCLR17_034]|uniref:hypothetical protein n=1 Tax=Curtobacterium sp. MCLR17_034 TaxID=2175623 RepID=UPI0015E8984E|nr:hypothetical protein [Curtobacterium sp. MCLR17_034]